MQCYDQWATFFDQLIQNDLKTYDNIRNIATGQWEITQLVACWTILFFKESFKLYLILIIILNTIDLSKQQALGADWKPMQEINWNGQITAFFII